MKGHISEDLNSPNKSSLGSVGQVPPVGSEVLPANVFGVMPQSAHLKQKELELLKWKYCQKIVFNCFTY